MQLPGFKSLPRDIVYHLTFVASLTDWVGFVLRLKQAQARGLGRHKQCISAPLRPNHFSLDLQHLSPVSLLNASLLADRSVDQPRWQASALTSACLGGATDSGWHHLAPASARSQPYHCPPPDCFLLLLRSPSVNNHRPQRPGLGSIVWQLRPPADNLPISGVRSGQSLFVSPWC